MSWQTTLWRLLLIQLQSATFNARQAAAVRGVFVLRLGKLLQSKQNIGKDRGQRQGCNCNAIKCHKINRRFPRLKILSCKKASTHRANLYRSRQLWRHKIERKITGSFNRGWMRWRASLETWASLNVCVAGMASRRRTGAAQLLKLPRYEIATRPCKF